MNNNSITVIIAAYNYGNYIGETLQSLIAQTHQNWECLVIDDGSTDNTRQVVSDFIKQEHRIKYILQDNGGQSSARNNGLRNANGKYIQFLDADDLLEPLKFEFQSNFLEEYPDIDMIYGESRYFRTGFPDERRYSISEPDEPWMPKISGQGEFLVRRLIESNIMTVSSPLIRRSLVDRVGMFDSTLDPLEDWDFWVRCAIANGKLHFAEAEKTFDLIRIHSLSSSQNRTRLFKKHKLARKKFNSLLPSHELRKFNKFMWLDKALYKGIGEFQNRKIRDGFASIWQAVSFDPATTMKFISNAFKRKIMLRNNADLVI